VSQIIPDGDTLQTAISPDAVGAEFCCRIWDAFARSQCEDGTAPPRNPLRMGQTLGYPSAMGGIRPFEENAVHDGLAPIKVIRQGRRTSRKQPYGAGAFGDGGRLKLSAEKHARCRPLSQRGSDHQLSLRGACPLEFDDGRDRLGQRHDAADRRDELALLGRPGDARQGL
jgi:hypothetical protein